MERNRDASKVWLVTGASKGLGLSLVKQLLVEGYRVAATSRDVEGLKTAVGLEVDGFLPLQVDLVDEGSVARAVSRAIEVLGRVDVIVNNAGYGQLGTLEELSDGEARRNFDANVFGALNVIRNVMPHFRGARSGRILNISSVGGFVGAFPGWGIYCASKFAMAGFTEALAAEASEFDVHATVVYPGYFRTDFLESGSLRLPAQPIAAYSQARALETAHTDDIRGNQPGDPQKAAMALIRLAGLENPPLHFFMGSDAYGMAHGQLDSLRDELLAQEAWSKSTDYGVQSDGKN